MRDTMAQFIVCDVCGRGPSSKVFVRPQARSDKPRSHAEVIRWARRAGRRIGLQIKWEIEHGRKDTAS